MNPASAFVIAAIAVLLVLAVRYLVKNGPCPACGEAENCRGSAGGCSGSCGGCSHSGVCHPK